MAVLTIAQAQQLVSAALMRCRTDAGNAACVAAAVVAAEADGLTGHGMARVPTYAAQAKSGKVDGLAKPTGERVRPGLLAIDAANGFAYPALALAEAALPDMARHSGLAAAAIRRSHHCGAAGHPVEHLARHGLVAVLLANTPAAIAPWGGSIAVFGTNPVAFACPLPGRAPIVVDLALSTAARGNILAAKQKGERIPADWALDAAGRPTTDPDAALAGTMVPIGQAKGTALALAVELLAAGLTGANFAAEASSFLTAAGEPPGTGQLILAFDPAAFATDAVGRFGVLAAAIERQSGARLPGARRLAARAKAARDGLVVAPALLADIASV